MFDIGFWELMLIGVIGLIVLGPERLPVAVRTVKGWITGVRQFSDTVKSELTEELRIHELHANLKKAEQADMTNLSPEVAESVKSLREAADMVNEPFKKVDTAPLDAMISSSLKEPAYNESKNSGIKSDVEKSNELLNSEVKQKSTTLATEEDKQDK